jgi:PAS domain-containing protein
MSNPFEKVGEIASKINNPYSLAALALVSIHFSLYAISDLDPRWKPWLLSGTLLAAIMMLLILRTRPDVTPTVTAEEKMLTAIKSLIDCSNVPMYLTDSRLIVLYCNHSLAELFDSNASALIGRHLTEMVKRMALRVPKPRRQEFLARQGALVDKVASDLAPHSEDIEIVDNSNLPGNRFHGCYKVWIHADKISVTPAGREIGVFVFYRLEPMTTP